MGDNMRKFTESDFTEDQLMLLKMAFALAETVVETPINGYRDVDLCNELFYLKEKLGIDDIIN